MNADAAKTAAPDAQDQAAPRAFEHETCSRCGGTGHYSYCQTWGTVCFKCGGKKAVLTKRGMAAQDFFTASCSVPASELQVGQKFWDKGGPLSRAGWRTILEIKPLADSGWVVPAGAPPVLYLTLVTNGGTYSTSPETSYRVAQSKEDKAAKLAAAYDYQDSLTKAGTPRKAIKAKKAAQPPVEPVAAEPAAIEPVIAEAIVVAAEPVAVPAAPGPRAAGWKAEAWSDLAIGDWQEDHYQGLVVWGVRLTNAHGERFVYTSPIMVGTEKSAQAFADRVNGHIQATPYWSPNWKFWEETYPVYGSEAYVEQEPQLVAEEEREALEAEMFPDRRFAYTSW